MNESPTIANVIAQIAISGTTQGGTTAAPQHVVVKAMVDLGLPKEEVDAVLQRALDLDVVLKNGEFLHIAE